MPLDSNNMPKEIPPGEESREALYEAYNKTSGVIDGTPEPEDPGKQEPVADTVQDGDPAPEDPGKQEPVADTVQDGDPAPEDPGKQEPVADTVQDGDPAPDNAEDIPESLSEYQKMFYQERAKRRKLRTEHAAEMQALKEKFEPKEPESVELAEIPDSFDDIDGALKKAYQQIQVLNSTVTKMQATDSQRREYEKEVTATKQVADTNRLIQELSEELSAEGCPGFDMLVEEMNRDLRSLGVEKAGELNNSEGYKEVYRTITYPKIAKMLNRQHNTVILDQRNKLKESGLNLANSQVVGNGVTKKEKTWTPEDYIREIRGIPPDEGN